MSSGDIILETIRKDSQKNIEEIRERSRAKCDSINDKARAKVREINDEAEKKMAEQSEKLKKSYKSRTELEKRNMLLKAKRAEIDRTVDSVLTYMNYLGTEDYFELVFKLALTLGKKEGVIFFNERDLRRVPSDFIKRLNDNGLAATVSDTPDNSIKSGFILKNGDIEDNMSFASLIADRREEIEDLINRELFKD